jgi:hypothetical protein
MVQFEHADHTTDEISRKFHASKMKKANNKRKKNAEPYAIFLK